MRSIRIPSRILVAAAALMAAGSLAPVATGAHGTAAQAQAAQAAATPGRHLTALGNFNLAAAARSGRPASTATRYSVQPEVEKRRGLNSLVPRLTLGGSGAPASTVVTDGPSGGSFDALNILAMEKAGTGTYAGTNGGLEPPDQALCVGNGFVLEGVNTAWRVYTTTGTPITPAVPITQFFKIAPGGQASPPSSFVSDPRCLYDSVTKRFFALTLEADEASGLTQVPFIRAHTYFAVSKTSDPTGDWSIFNIDITDDGQQGTPLHASCPCIDDQPLMGINADGLFLSANEYSDSEIFPVAPPGQVYNVINTLPDYRNGQAQVYALSKADLVAGVSSPVQAFDTKNNPLPAADQGTTGALWSSLQPAASPPGDQSAVPAGGAEFFLSPLDFAGTGDNRVGVWAVTNTSSLNTATPAVQLKNTVITTVNPTTETYVSPFTDASGGGVDQKVGPIPLGATCTCAEEQINANDDRMNQVMLTNGVLWSGVNTVLPAIDATATTKPNKDPRNGIMYFAVQPGLDGSGNVTATMLRDGYVQVAGNNVLFPSIAANTAGDVAMFFSLSGVDYFPSAAWTRLDHLAAGAAPVVHVSGVGSAPEDGFTGYPTTAQAGLPLDPSQGQSGVSRWGDYSAAGVDENGCLWGASEYIPTDARDPAAGNWGTYITRVQPDTCSATPITPVTSNACLPLFTDPTGDDEEGTGIAPVPATTGQNPQLDLTAGDLKASPDGSVITATLTLNNLSRALPSGGQTNEYYMYWTSGATSYYANAAVTATTAVYSDGTVASNGSRTQRAGSTSDTGALVLGPGGTVAINVPSTAVGSPAAGATLTGAHAETRELEGAAVVEFDGAGPGNDYIVGSSCLAANVPEAPAAVILPLGAGSAGLLLVVVARRRRLRTGG